MNIPSAAANTAGAKNSLARGKPGILMCGMLLSASLAFWSAQAGAQSSSTSQPAPSVVQSDVKLVIGGGTIKDNSNVTLSIVGSALHIATDKTTMDIEASSILDISTNEDSRQDITGAAKLATAAIPYGGGRVLSLFSHNVDVLTVEFTDASAAYHGVVFVLPQGQAAPIKKQLVAMGAKASAPLGVAPETNK
jgi:hypothetical protein